MIYLPGTGGGNLLNPYAPPPSIGLKAWFRSDMGVTVSGGNVSQWQDLSGNGFTLSQATAGLRPAFSAAGGVNGLPKLVWPTTALSGFMLQNTAFTYSTNTQGAEVFVIGTPTATVSVGGLYMVDLGENNDALLINAGNQVSSYNGAFLDGTVVPLYTPLVANAFFSTLGTGTDFNAPSGAAPTSGNAGSTAQAATLLTIGCYGGGTYAWEGDIYEALVYARQLLPFERSQLLSYFTNRYSIPIVAA